MPTKKSSEEQLLIAVKELRAAVQALPEHLEDLYNPRKRLVMFFLRGVLYGVGILVAVAIVVPLLIALLQSVQWVPLLGDFIADIAVRIDAARSGL